MGVGGWWGWGGGCRGGGGAMTKINKVGGLFCGWPTAAYYTLL